MKATKTTDFYKWTDLYFGAELNVYGRKLVVLDCDGFTREWYESQGIDLGDGLVMDLPAKVIPSREPPPHGLGGGGLGIGSEEDSLGSCKYLLPKPPKRDIKKLLDFDRKILRFAAKFDNPCSGICDCASFITKQYLITIFL